MFQFSCLTRWPLSLTLKLLLTSRKTLNYTRNNKTWNQFVHQEGTAIIMQLQHLLCSCTPTSSKSTKPYMFISNRFPIFDMLFKPTGEKPSFFNALRMSCCLFSAPAITTLRIHIQARTSQVCAKIHVARA